MLPWYQNPGWFALLFAASSFGVSILAFFTARRSMRITVQQRITQQIAEINESFVKYEVKGPYATQLGIADADVKKFAAKSMVLFHQLNLLRLVFQNRDVIGSRALASYESWARNILGKWIGSDSELGSTWKLFCDTRDLDGPEFHDWLQGLMPISEDKGTPDPPLQQTGLATSVSGTS
jgi:hypothetical protein